MAKELEDMFSAMCHDGQGLTLDQEQRLSKSLEKVFADNMELRCELWMRHGCSGLYGDDGEMSCGSCVIDFRRDDVGWIIAKLRAAAEKKLSDAMAKAASEEKRA